MRYDVEGYNLDNLMKTLYLKKVTLMNVEKTKNKLSFTVNDKDEKLVKRYITNFKVKSTLSYIKRLPKIVLMNIGILIGVIIGIVSFSILSHYTWDIRIYGTEALSEDEILSVLEDNGIKIGKINTQSTEDIESIMLNNYDRIAQVSVIKQGTTIIINLSEKLVYVEEEYEPILAKQNGIITAVNVITGTANVKIGDYVNKGDMLVLPFNINANGEKVSVRPLADITAKMYVVSKVEMQKKEDVLVRSGRSSIEYKYKLFNFNIFSGKNKNSFALFERVMYNENVSEIIPFSRDVYIYHELVHDKITHDFELEQGDLINKSIDLARESLPVGEILSEDTDVSVVEDKMFACTTIIVLGNINADI